MRKTFLLFGLLLACAILFVACADEEPTSPEALSFKKVSYTCGQALQIQKTAIDGGIDIVLDLRKSKKGAHQIVDNIARKVCAIPPQLDPTPYMVEDFYKLLVKQPIEELVGGWEAAVDLLTMVSEFATGAEFGGGFPVPPEALGPDGGYGFIFPGIAGTIVANNGEAALVADPGSFPGVEEPVPTAFFRTPDPQPDVPGDPVPGYQAYPEAWGFSGGADPTGGLEFWMCVVEDDLPIPFGQLVIGHDLGDGEAELLEPPLYDPEGLIIDCTNASYQLPILILGAATPGWLQLAGLLLEPIAKRVLDVNPLNASFFAGRGLGGRGTSFSDFSPVDSVPDIPDPVIAFVESELNVEDLQNPGTFFNRYSFTTTNWANFPAFLFEITDAYGPCGDNDFPSRTWLEIYDASDDSNIYGFCAFDSTDDLSSFWFSTPPGQGPPDIYIELWDRAEDVTYPSNTVAVPTVINTLTIEGAGTGSGTITRTGFFNCSYDGASATTSGNCTGSTVDWVILSTIVATADPGSTFDSWSGACTGTGECSVPMDADKTAVATFTAIVVQ